MKKLWSQPKILKIELKKITLSGSDTGNEGTGTGNRNKKN